ncbi:hypothetical protein GRF29_44g2658545 [Pseudopithomyces chartarum]|uniref:Glutathione S-transferase n=1 Tax=Pseudopithomyces chartarum TaxID=1892770 RepID=A0AAN6RJN1_9PLEO|nr:hypothetical protein GRF29_44g2658545 [Pseudopithomyces chartarum]
MAFGTLYTRNPNPRSFAIIAVSKLLNIDLAVQYLDRENPEDEALLYKLNPLRQVPIFVGEDGFKLTECTAILQYVTSQSPTTPLLGHTPTSPYEIQKWLSFANSDLLPAIGGIILPLLRLHNAVQKDVQDCLRALHADLALLQNHLQGNKFLLGDEITIADYFVIPPVERPVAFAAQSHRVRGDGTVRPERPAASATPNAARAGVCRSACETPTLRAGATSR